MADDGAPLGGRVALMAQSDMLLPWLSLTDNLMLGASLRGTKGNTRQAEEILCWVGLLRPTKARCFGIERKVRPVNIDRYKLNRIILVWGDI